MQDVISLALSQLEEGGAARFRQTGYCTSLEGLAGLVKMVFQ